MSERLRQQAAFLVELAKLKTVIRRSYICGGLRKENSAEHSWHAALTVLLLAEHASAPIDALRAARMMLVHDIVEIDAGDAFIYAAEARGRQEAREQAAAGRLFGLLPEDQAKELRALWEEFEAKATPEAKFARAIDRLIPLLQNYHARGKTWLEHGVTRDQVLKVNAPIGEASEELWRYAKNLIESAAEQGWLG